jgi:phenylalanyl-tRNA synthetase alpha chain
MGGVTQPTSEAVTQLVASLASIETETLAGIAAAQSLDALKAVESAAVGKQGRLTELNKSLSAMTADERKTAGAALNGARAGLVEAVAARRVGLAAEASAAGIRAIGSQRGDC